MRHLLCKCKMKFDLNSSIVVAITRSIVNYDSRIIAYGDY